MRRHLERRLADWNPGDDAPPPQKQTQLPEPETCVVDAFRCGPPAGARLYLGHLGIRRERPRLSRARRDGLHPRHRPRLHEPHLACRLRDELGLAYAVGADIHSSAGLLPGTFKAYIGTSPEHVGTALEGFLREIRRIQDEPVGEDELQTAKDYLVGAFALSFQRSSRRAGYMISAERHKLPEDNLVRLPRQFAAVTPEDVQRVARKHLFPEASCVAAAGPITTAQLRKLVAR